MYKQETHLFRAFGSLRWSQAVTAIHFHSANEISSVYCPFENSKIYPTDQSWNLAAYRDQYKWVKLREYKVIGSNGFRLTKNSMFYLKGMLFSSSRRLLHYGMWSQCYQISQFSKRDQNLEFHVKFPVKILCDPNKICLQVEWGCHRSIQDLSLDYRKPCFPSYVTAYFWICILSPPWRALLPFSNSLIGSEFFP